MNANALMTGQPQFSPAVRGIIGLVPRMTSTNTGEESERRVPVPHLISGHAMAGLSGVLAIERDTTLRTIHFIGGGVVWAESSDSDHRFSDWLIRSGTVTPTAADEATSIVRSGECRYGEALLRVDAIGPRELGAAAEEFVTEVVVSAFSWRRGCYDFAGADTENLRFEPPVHMLRPIRIERLIFEGFEHMTDESLAAAWLGDLAAPRSFAADPFRYVGIVDLSERQAALLMRVASGCFSIAEVMALGILTPEETLKFLGAFDAIGELIVI
jgi:hypothetical protein